MPRPHFSNIESHTDLGEPVYPNLYEVILNLPPAVEVLHPRATNGLLLENTISAVLPTYPKLTTKSQRFKFSTRLFVDMPTQTSVESFDIKFNINVNKQTFQSGCWRVIKDWYDLAWNNEDGTTHYKRNMISDCVIHVHDKEGHVIRRVTYFNVQNLGISGWETLDWGSNEIATLTASFCADYWSDLYY